MNYYILSLKWSKNKPYLVWWATNDSGYRADLNEAGVYTEKQIAENPGYYDNRVDTVAIPVDEARKYVKQVVFEIPWELRKGVRGTNEKTC